MASSIPQKHIDSDVDVDAQVDAWMVGVGVEESVPVASEVEIRDLCFFSKCFVRDVCVFWFKAGGPKGRNFRSS